MNTYLVELIAIYSCVLGCELCSFAASFFAQVCKSRKSFLSGYTLRFFKAIRKLKLPSNKQQERGMIVVFFKFSTLCLQSISLKLFKKCF